MSKETLEKLDWKKVFEKSPFKMTESKGKKKSKKRKGSDEGGDSIMVTIESFEEIDEKELIPQLLTLLIKSKKFPKPTVYEIKLSTSIEEAKE